jgi:hypothetical protein
MEKWGVDISDPEATFEEMDLDGKGLILFDEFANWAIRRQLDLTDDDVPAALDAPVPALDAPVQPARNSRARSPLKSRPKAAETAFVSADPKHTSDTASPAKLIDSKDLKSRPEWVGAGRSSTSLSARERTAERLAKFSPSIDAIQRLMHIPASKKEQQRPRADSPEKDKAEKEKAKDGKPAEKPLRTDPPKRPVPQPVIAPKASPVKPKMAFGRPVPSDSSPARSHASSLFSTPAPTLSRKLDQSPPSLERLERKPAVPLSPGSILRTARLPLAAKKAVSEAEVAPPSTVSSGPPEAENLISAAPTPELTPASAAPTPESAPPSATPTAPTSEPAPTVSETGKVRLRSICSNE